jgi:hypothetical protein
MLNALANVLRCRAISGCRLPHVQVKSVEPAESALFGFPSNGLVGASLCDFLDVFTEWREMNGVSELQLFMLALLDKEAEMPGGCALWRQHALPDRRPSLRVAPPTRLWSATAEMQHLCQPPQKALDPAE